MDEAGFFEGELTGGRRGLAPSNLIVSDDLMTILPPQPADFLQNTDHEVSFCSKVLALEEKGIVLTKESVSVLADRLGDRDSS